MTQPFMSVTGLTPPITAFAGVAERFCSWVETPRRDQEAEMRALRKLLAELHAAILHVKIEDRGEITAENMVPNETWGDIYQSFSGRLPINDYWDVFDPLASNPNQGLVCNSLADDLTDMYRDLKNGLSLFQQGYITEAAWEWRFTFEIHWGTHLTGAQRAIHSYFTSAQEPPTKS